MKAKTKNNKAAKTATKTTKPNGKEKTTAWVLFDVPAAAIARQLGKLKWPTADAIKAIQAKLPKMSRFSIRNAVWEGKHGWDRPTASLTKAQIATLKKLAA